MVYGALYEMMAGEKPLLDQCEGQGYSCDTLPVDYRGESYETFVYIAEDSHIDDRLIPHRWYQQIVLLGAEFHRLPQDYLNYIREVHTADDPDIEQQSRNLQLIEEMRIYTGK